MTGIITNNLGRSSGLKIAVEAGGGGLVFIKKITASSDGSISFQNGTADVVIDGTYDNYIIKFSNVRPATQDKRLDVQMYTGDTIRTSGYQCNTIKINGSSGGEGVGVTYQEITSGCANFAHLNNQTEKGLDGELCFSTPTDTSQWSTVTYQGGIQYDGEFGRVISYVGTGGYMTSGTALTGFNFLFDSGDIAEGVFTLYGMVKA